MRRGFLQARDCYRRACIGTAVSVALGVERFACVILLVVGLGLLSGGLFGLSNAQVNPPEGATGQPPPGAINFLPQPTIWFAPQAALQVTPETSSEILVAPENQDGDYDDRLQRNATGNLFRLIEGAFGALIMVVAGLGSIIAAAMGAYKMALTLLVVAVGAFILRSLVSLFFGTDYPASDTAGNPIGAI